MAAVLWEVWRALLTSGDLVVLWAAGPVIGGAGAGAFKIELGRRFDKLVDT
ncbi:hypothetical protein BZB76_5730 [Actinomadura pelletieri DSM 43383]|uniref:Uncharacterized protein n=1 Tax=Actinomadura pelletieri DSM 43383 TaxID=1120940 RepID=A0A495QHM3_9ACTN|nr:hypothetical protein BZB76_5730 [Actinomadura pelletieri DSM 43383]